MHVVQDQEAVFNTNAESNTGTTTLPEPSTLHTLHNDATFEPDQPIDFHQFQESTNIQTPNQSHPSTEADSIGSRVKQCNLSRRMISNMEQGLTSPLLLGYAAYVSGDPGLFSYDDAFFFESQHDEYLERENKMSGKKHSRQQTKQQQVSVCT